MPATVARNTWVEIRASNCSGTTNGGFGEKLGVNGKRAPPLLVVALYTGAEPLVATRNDVAVSGANASTPIWLMPESTWVQLVATTDPGLARPFVLLYTPNG